MFPVNAIPHRAVRRSSRSSPVGSLLFFDSPFKSASSLMRFYGLAIRDTRSCPRGRRSARFARTALLEFQVRPVWVSNAPLAIAEVTYLRRSDSVSVECTVTSLEGPLPEISVMNEVGADHFDASIRSGTVRDPPSGWCELPLRQPCPALWDSRSQTAFTIDRIECEEGMDVSLFWGREKQRFYAGQVLRSNLEISKSCRRSSYDTNCGSRRRGDERRCCPGLSLLQDQCLQSSSSFHPWGSPL